MKFKSTINEVKKAIQVLLPIINHNHQTLPYRYLFIRKFEDKIEIKAYDDYIMGSAFLNCYDIEDKEETAYVLGKQFISLINSFNSGEVQFEIKDDKLKISKGKSHYTLPTLDDSLADETLAKLYIDYYSLKNNGNKIKTDSFSTSYISVNHCLSRDDSQLSLQNVFLKNNKMIACDSIRGAVVDFVSPIEDLMLHKKICECIINVNSPEIMLIQQGDKIFGKTDNFIFVSTVSDDYPYESIKSILDAFNPEKFKNDIQIDPDEVSEKLSRVLMFADSETNAIQLSIDGVDFSILVDNQSSAKETISIFKNIKGDNLSLYLDGKNLKEALSKSMSETHWFTDGEERVQYISDGSLLQFFLGLSK